MRRGRAAAGAVLLAAMAAIAVAASGIAPHEAGQQFPDMSYAPPMRPRLLDANGRPHRPFVYPLRLVDRLTHTFVEDRTVRVPLRILERGTLVNTDASATWLVLGGDALGRDVFARLVLGARLSIGVALASTAGALLLGSLIGAAAGFRGGRLDEGLMRVADFVLVLPAIYVVIVLRGALPLVLTTAEVFWIMAGILSGVGWPFAARGVRAIVAAERTKEYAEAATAMGAGEWRILLRHLLPAARGFLVVQGTLLVPSFILAEATLSFVGFGFAEPTPSWGVMLHEASQAGTLADAPWLLAPAAAIVVLVLSLQLVSGSGQPFAATARERLT